MLTFTVKDEHTWGVLKANNTDEYGSGVIRYAARWAALMEQKIKAGAALEDIAESASHQADTEGISGWMYGRAVAVLAKVWEHGERLRRWHNLDTQISGEGEAANADGGVLNPALLRVEKL